MTTAARPLPSRAQAALVAGLLGLAAAAWAVTADRMEGMDAGPGTELGGLGWFAVVWVTMMAAMMLPAVAPATLRAARGGAGPVPFVAGYLLAWTAAGLLGYALVEGVRALDPGFLAWDDAGPYVAGAVILTAAAYELSRPKQRWLRRCREPRLRAGALHAGVEQGASCVACCWALMASLFALGVMSVGWMVLVAALIAVERVLPWPAVTTRAVALLLAVLALGVAFAPGDVPGLTIPEPAMHDMSMDAG